MATQTTYLELTKQAGGEMPDVEILNGDLDIIDEAVGTRPKTVNGEGPDASGNIRIEEVEYAGNLRSEQTQRSTGTYLRRTTGGNAALETGDAWLVAVRGHREWTGHEDEELTVTSSNDGLSVSIDRDEFLEYASHPTEETTVLLTYSSGSWSVTPGQCGVTVTGTPQNGDTITIYYAPEERGTIVQSTPARFVATGWNLYEPASGYARVVKYSDEYGYRIVGAYTALAWSETVNGARSPLTVGSSGLFQVPADGFVHVTGGSASTTAVYTTWSDMQAQVPGGVFATYAEHVIDLSGVLQNDFAYGLCQVGSVYDEINLSSGTATSWIGRMLYTAENLATVQASGRAYEADENYIYYVKASPDTYAISVSNGYTADQYGMEFVDGSSVPATCETLYGTNLKNKLERNVLTISQQTLSEAEQLQVLNNIGMDVRELSTTLNSAVAAGLVTEYSNVINISNSNTMFRLIKFGRVVMMSGMFYTYAGEQYPLTNELTLVKLAKSVRPIVATYLPLYNSEYRLYGSKGLSINSGTGEMKLRTSTTMDPGTAFRFFGIYISAE